MKNLTIKNAEYHESNIATTSDTQFDITRNPETVTHTSNGNETFTQTSSGNFEQKLLSNRTIPVLKPPMNPGTDQGIVPIILAPQTLLKPATKEVATDTASVGMWINRNTKQVSRTWVDRSAPGSIRNSCSVIEPPSPFSIVIFDTSPPCGLNVIQ